MLGKSLFPEHLLGPVVHSSLQQRSSPSLIGTACITLRISVEQPPSASSSSFSAHSSAQAWIRLTSPAPTTLYFARHQLEPIWLLCACGRANPPSAVVPGRPATLSPSPRKHISTQSRTFFFSPTGASSCAPSPAAAGNARIASVASSSSAVGSFMSCHQVAHRLVFCIWDRNALTHYLPLAKIPDVHVGSRPLRRSA